MLQSRLEHFSASTFARNGDFWKMPIARLRCGSCKVLNRKANCGFQGQGLIHTAAREGQHEAIKMLIEWEVSGLDTRYGSSSSLLPTLQKKTSRDSRGRTPLWLAASGQHPATCSLLIDAGADPLVLDNQGVSVEELARKPDVKDIIAAAKASAKDV